MQALYVGPTWQHHINGKEYEVEETSVACYGNRNGYTRHGLMAKSEITNPSTGKVVEVTFLGAKSCAQWKGDFSEKFGTKE